MASRLCDRCSALGLSVEKFLVQPDGPSDNSISVRSLQLANERYFVGSLGQIKDNKAACKLCALLSHAVPDPAPPETDDAKCHLFWEMDGRTSVENVKDGRRTRRLRICWSHRDLKRFESHLVLAAPPRYDSSDVNYRGLLNSETEFRGRRVGGVPNKQNLIRELLRLCEKKHDDRCTKKLGIEDDFYTTLTEPYFGVIDIEYGNLVPLPFEEKDDQLEFESYATVSYVWGETGSREHTTRMGNIQSRRKSGGLASVIETLPRALQQGIRLVHDLGIRYIWIDALCIVQDSSHSWNLNARAMHLIYGNSIFTLSIADDPDATTGLLALDKDRQPKQWIEECADGLHLLLHHPPEASIEASRWNKRAWTFQERLLSKRCLIFTGGRIYFQCRSTVVSEDIFADHDGAGWSLDLVRSPLQMLSQLNIRALWFYTHCVSLYTLRELHEPFDILSAFSGMCKLMESTMHSPFIFGLPTSHFDFALLWQPIGRSLRLSKPKRSDDPKYKDMKLPSWSWCGWENEGIEYVPEMVEGCLPDVGAWLLDHTWIDWHIRDGYGTLRRVWDRTRAEGDESTNIRWRGYKVTGREASPDNSDRSSSASLLPFRAKGQSSRTQYYRTSTNTVPAPKSTSRKGRQRRSTRTTPRQKSDSGSSDSDDKSGGDLGSDPYGRLRQEGAMSDSLGKPREDFTLTLPEDPYHVRKTSERYMAGSVQEFPDQIFLQFFTWRASFHVVPATANSGDQVDGGDVGSGLRRCHIMDQRGDKCGSIVVDEKWLERHQKREPIEDDLPNGLAEKADEVDNTDKTERTEFEFIAISEAKAFTKEEFPDWTYYIPKERVESDWDLFFVLLVEHLPMGGFYERVALGKVFKAAFSLSDDEWREIILG
ncbi:uncharacterized protein Z520_11010 [Fonsecaea multimorphosa CBS 102226]|uniref:Heterokaryon incompatibility domain-containing protein n=1 Tax=Fonsecaea multimorphosa CBS 102226 TaxID=1442371 RepID=A0A0D2JJK2_9EURO|nr:uncharacterized protein Z520_11010 [Fonsecaea multimorphosa CBS 102226]KIX93367.1 hypothetical protein Z520_11010 [Fonsecaea multimorphosa CBS 102226]OAL18603.1 hypothetical protein AYO22_10580 [Fonsecaea multimorphosa]